MDSHRKVGLEGSHPPKKFQVKWARKELPIASASESSLAETSCLAHDARISLEEVECLSGQRVSRRKHAAANARLHTILSSEPDRAGLPLSKVKLPVSWNENKAVHIEQDRYNYKCSGGVGFTESCRVEMRTLGPCEHRVTV